MRKKPTLLVLLFAALLVVLYACQKQDVDDTVQPSASFDVAGVKAWLSSQSANFTPGEKALFTRYLDWSKATINQTGSEQTAVWVPLDYGKALLVQKRAEGENEFTTYSAQDYVVVSKKGGNAISYEHLRLIFEAAGAIPGDSPRNISDFTGQQVSLDKNGNINGIANYKEGKFVSNSTFVEQATSKEARTRTNYYESPEAACAAAKCGCGCNYSYYTFSTPRRYCSGADDSSCYTDWVLKAYVTATCITPCSTSTPLPKPKPDPDPNPPTPDPTLCDQLNDAWTSSRDVGVFWIVIKGQGKYRPANTDELLSQGVSQAINEHNPTNIFITNPFAYYTPTPAQRALARQYPDRVFFIICAGQKVKLDSNGEVVTTYSNVCDALPITP